MAEVHVTLNNPTIVFHNPANQQPLPPGAGQPVTQTKSANGQIIKTSGQVPGTTVFRNNPA